MINYSSLARYVAKIKRISLDDAEDIITFSGPGPYSYGETYDVNGVRVLILDAYAADAALDAHLDEYIEDHILRGVSGVLNRYFDRKAFKKDAKMDGVGHHLNPYDGGEDDTDDGRIVMALGPLW